MYLPSELWLHIYNFYNPYKQEYKKSLEIIKNKGLYKGCMRQLKQYCLYNRDKKLICFNKEAILKSI